MDNGVCELCQTPGGRIVYDEALCRVVLVEAAGYPGFCRVILNRHVAEMSDLPVGERQRLMEVTNACELALRQLLEPDKINLASFGNVCPHLHWHVIPRWHDDPHFPQPYWGLQQRPAFSARQMPDVALLAGLIARSLAPV